MPVVLEMLQAAGELRGRLEQVGNDDDEAALAERLGRLVQRLLDVARALRLDLFHLEQHGAERIDAGDGGEALRQPVGEERERDRVALADEQVHQPGGERAGVLELGDRAGLLPVQAGRGIDQHAVARRLVSSWKRRIM